ncbi:MAG: hypothetical protein EPO40_28635 [Myxococcaceae bacterium]|nr:MAG: hypothetical protein EPO40_28635 [Myxococcaceae bacterium]
MARTGFGSRFLLGQRNSGLAGRALITTFVLAIALVFCGGAVVACSNGLREVLDPRSALYRLRLPSSGAVVRLSAPIRATSGDQPPLCVVQHEHYVSGKNGGWRLDGTWNRSAGATLLGQSPDARALDRPPLSIRIHEPVDFDPYAPWVVTAEQEAWFRTVLADVPYGGRLRAHCVASGETVFVEGCVDPDGAHLTGCGSTPLTITTGDGTAQPRIDDHASLVAGRLSAGAAAILVALAYLWYVLRARPLADALLRRAGPVPTFRAWPMVVGVVALTLALALAQGVVVWTAATGSAASRGRPGYLFGLLACATAALFALAVRHRRQNLERAMAPVREAQTVPLRDARGGVVELAVSVRDDGAPAAGVLDARPHAWVEVRVEETVAVGKQQVTQLVARKYWPALIPVSDASGSGLIDPSHAEVDLRSTVKTYKQGSSVELARTLAQSPIGTLNPSAGHLRWTVEQSVLDPGESLYVLGPCRRIEDPKAASSYRMDSTMAVVGGTAADRIILHAGDERSLLRSIGLERTYLDLLTAALAGVALSQLAIMLALWAL